MSDMASPLASPGTRGSLQYFQRAQRRWNECPRPALSPMPTTTAVKTTPKEKDTPTPSTAATATVLFQKKSDKDSKQLETKAKKPSESHRDRLVAFYEKYNPSKLDSVETTLSNYRGREDELFAKLEQKYVGKSGLPPSGGTGPTCFIEFEGRGRVEIVLFADKTPLACENFRALCTGEQGASLCYQNSIIHRIVQNFCVQGGDFTKGDGTGGRSIYKPPQADMWGNFEDEDFMRHDCKGLLSMANNGRNRNGSQFFFTLKALPYLDGKHVVFGKVTKGMNVVEDISKIATDKNQRPLERVVIADCGELKDDGTEIRASVVQADNKKASASQPAFGVAFCGTSASSSSGATPFSSSATTAKPFSFISGTSLSPTAKPFSFSSQADSSKSGLFGSGSSSQQAFGAGAGDSTEPGLFGAASSATEDSTKRLFGSNQDILGELGTKAGQSTQPSLFGSTAKSKEPFGASAEDSTKPGLFGSSQETKSKPFGGLVSSGSTSSATPFLSSAVTATPFSFVGGTSSSTDASEQQTETKSAPLSSLSVTSDAANKTDSSKVSVFGSSAATSAPLSFSELSLKTDTANEESVTTFQSETAVSFTQSERQAMPVSTRQRAAYQERDLESSDESSRSTTSSEDSDDGGEAEIEASTPFSSIRLDPTEQVETLADSPPSSSVESTRDEKADETPSAGVGFGEIIRKDVVGEQKESDSDASDVSTYNEDNVKSKVASTTPSKSDSFGQTESPLSSRTLAASSKDEKDKPFKNPFIGVNFADKVQSDRTAQVPDSNPFAGFTTCKPGQDDSTSGEASSSPSTPDSANENQGNEKETSASPAGEALVTSTEKVQTGTEKTGIPKPGSFAALSLSTPPKPSASEATESPKEEKDKTLTKASASEPTKSPKEETESEKTPARQLSSRRIVPPSHRQSDKEEEEHPDKKRPITPEPKSSAVDRPAESPKSETRDECPTNTNVDSVKPKQQETEEKTPASRFQSRIVPPTRRKDKKDKQETTFKNPFAGINFADKAKNPESKPFAGLIKPVSTAAKMEAETTEKDKAPEKQLAPSPVVPRTETLASTFTFGSPAPLADHPPSDPFSGFAHGRVVGSPKASPPRRTTPSSQPPAFLLRTAAPTSRSSAFTPSSTSPARDKPSDSSSPLRSVPKVNRSTNTERKSAFTTPKSSPDRPKKYTLEMWYSDDDDDEDQIGSSQSPSASTLLKVSSPDGTRSGFSLSVDDENGSDESK